MSMDTTPFDAPNTDVEPVVEPSSTDSVGSQPTESVQESFSRDYVEKLREEAASRRVALKPYEDAFGGYNDEERQIWMNLARITAEDPIKGAEYFEQVAKSLREQNTPVDPSTLTPEERAQQAVEAKLAEYEAKQAEERKEADLQRQVKEINDKATALGYTVGDVDHLRLLYYAQNQTNGDLAKADELVKAANQKVIDDYVNGKRLSPPLVNTGQQVPPTPNEPKTFEDARNALEAWLGSQPGE